MSNALQACTVCASPFELRFGYQILKSGDSTSYFCSQNCNTRHLFAAERKTCCVCSASFDLEFAYQQNANDGLVRYFCTSECRHKLTTPPPRAGAKATHRIAVLNQKGGVGKTTTSVNVAAGLAEAGFKTLLVDLDAQGNVAVSLGLKSPRTVGDLILGTVEASECILNVSPNLDAMISNRTLAHAEVQLINMKDRHKILAMRMRNITQYDYVVIDCGPSLSVLNQNALTYAQHILIPVSCDFLALVGVREILQTLKQVNELLMHPVSILAVVPTLFDSRTRSSVEAIQTLQAYFKDRVLPPVRVNTRLKEAPSMKKSIFEFAPDSHGAEDYRVIVKCVIDLCAAEAANGEGEVLREQPVA